MQHYFQVQVDLLISNILFTNFAENHNNYQSHVFQIFGLTYGLAQNISAMLVFTGYTAQWLYNMV